jgi:predicted Rossmann fold nucleotide-binding protein DprA/Smf involved in DNA uptake
MSQQYQIYLSGQKAYPSGSSLETQSVRDVLGISPSTFNDICSKTYLSKSKTMQALRELDREGVLKTSDGKYFLIEN